MNSPDATDSSKSTIIVVMPDLMGRGFVDPSAAKVLEAWRDGRFQLAVNRWMIVRYLRTLKRFGIRDSTLRWWTWWFTSRAKVRHAGESPLPSSDPFQIANELARQTQATAVIHPGSDPALDQVSTDIRWISAAKFLLDLETQVK